SLIGKKIHELKSKDEALAHKEKDKRSLDANKEVGKAHRCSHALETKTVVRQAANPSATPDCNGVSSNKAATTSTIL
nr:hypothetical protein [Tanacetum cinerariifolium]